MYKTFQACAVAFGGLAILLVVVALACPNWMQACIPMDKVLDASSQMTLNMPGGGAGNIDQAKSYFSGQHACIRLGLFKIAVSMGNLVHVSVPISVSSLDTFVEAAAGLLILSCLLFIPALVLVGLSACSASVSVSRKLSARNYAKIGMVLMIIGTLFCGIAAVTYTVGQTPTVHNPMKFYGQMAAASQSMGSSFGGGMSSLNGASNPYGLGNGQRKRRQVADYESGFPTPGPVYGSVSPVDMDSSNQQAFDGQEIAQMMQMIDPVFDFSFYLTWAALLAAIIGSILSVLGLARMSMNSGDNYDAQLL